MKTYGLIGYPLSQSFSQKYFSDKFKNESIAARYLNFPIASIDELPQLLAKHPYIGGLNVTIPYKEKVMDYLTEIDPMAEEAGAVNVVKLDWSHASRPKLKGFNTDIIGFSESIKPLLKAQHKNALILGTGGAAKAVGFALEKMDIAYQFVSRSPQGQNQTIYEALNAETMAQNTIIINTTPLGMYGDMEAKPDIPYQYTSKQHLFFDLIYNPTLSAFLKAGQDQGASVKNGLEMLHLQAEAAWEIWNRE
ncbi:shikimate dehydrogenase [Saccharicrinis carchari]|uniref:Shikimate dehydrogenase n=1 Tax=Saccharicrinis carchari TaxID=1168039 RepID=A0A521EPR5_SACCC|nr:shikimate dehydrogenase [Saccharicrinis carchari]SMO85916.1 shikimate dehydrogenase [Saccharicrinis carchari]